MEGIAKSAESTLPQEFKHQISSEVLPNKPDANQYVLKYFGINPNQVPQKKEIDTISEWAFKDATPGQGLMKIRELETKLGYSGEDNRVIKLFNYITMLKNIESTEEIMNSELSSAEYRMKKDDLLKTDAIKGEIQELETKIKHARDRLQKATDAHRIQLTEATRIIKNKYKAQLDDLKRIAKAYKGGK